ncbi:MAG: glycosyltransferase family 4 protein [Prevotella sp.]|nr:glycosyltransferase family 4 protein [Prevotella sp.]
MKIAIITSGILPVPAVQGGAVENLIDYLLEYNNNYHLHDIFVYSVFNHKTSQHPALQSSVNHYEYIQTKTRSYRISAKIYSYIGHHYCYHYQLEYFFESVWRKMKDKHFDLIILENRPGFALQLSERTQTPIISHIHTNLLCEPSAINQQIVKSTYRFFAVSDYIKEEIKKVGIDCDIRTVYNGLDFSVFNSKSNTTICRKDFGFTDNDFVIVFWGRLVPKKGIKELILALELLKEQKDIKLLVIGSINFEDTDNQTNPFIEELREVAERVHGKITFTGFIPYQEIANYITLANVAVIPSNINEAFGMTCIEACALGLPVIATNDGGIPEALTGQKHVLIDKNSNLSEQLKDAILKVKNDYSSYLGNHLNPKFERDTYCRSFYNNLK